LLSRFPKFRQISLSDRPFVQDALWKYQPDTSELTFTNLFIWRIHYGIVLSLYQGWLLIVFTKTPAGAVGLPPIGPPARQSAARVLLDWLKGKGQDKPYLGRVDRKLISELAGANDFLIEQIRDDYDYVYRSRDLIKLVGHKYHAKRNFINTFRNNHQLTYEELTANNVAECLDMAARWCQQRHCDEDLSLASEWEAVNEALHNFSVLKIRGGVIRLYGRVEAFALGELLNSRTLVVHVEKANPDIRGLYPVINQQFAEHNAQQLPFVNREQDLGKAQLRQAKMSYRPDHFVEKFRIRLKDLNPTEVVR